MSKQLTFSCIGGDKRQIELVKSLANDDHLVKVYGLKPIEINNNAISQEKSLSSCINQTDAVILPFPYSIDGITIKSDFIQEPILIQDVIQFMNKNQILCAGKCNKILQTMVSKKNIQLIDYGTRDDLLIKNAIPTVEGALAIAINETKCTIHNSRCLVLGYGRIGKLLSKALSSLGASVSVSARKISDQAWITANGYCFLPFSHLENQINSFDIIFNTVPEIILTQIILQNINSSAVIIDLASMPGGVDDNAATALNRKVIHALSIPGKVAPTTAATIIKDTIYQILREMGVY